MSDDKKKKHEMRSATGHFSSALDSPFICTEQRISLLKMGPIVLPS